MKYVAENKTDPAVRRHMDYISELARSNFPKRPRRCRRALRSIRASGVVQARILSRSRFPSPLPTQRRMSSSAPQRGGGAARRALEPVVLRTEVFRPPLTATEPLLTSQNVSMRITQAAAELRRLNILRSAAAGTNTSFTPFATTAPAAEGTARRFRPSACTAESHHRRTTAPIGALVARRSRPHSQTCSVSPLSLPTRLRLACRVWPTDPGQVHDNRREFCRCSKLLHPCSQSLGPPSGSRCVADHPDPANFTLAALAPSCRARLHRPCAEAGAS